MEILNNSEFYDKIEITIAGNGELFNSYKKRFDQLNIDVIFLKWIEITEYKRYMNNCDIYIHASDFEPFGIPPLDALYRNKVIIVSKGVMSCIGFKPNNGLLFFENANELANHIKSLVLNKHDIYLFSANNYSILTEKYPVDIINRTLQKILF